MKTRTTLAIALASALALPALAQQDKDKPIAPSAPAADAKPGTVTSPSVAKSGMETSRTRNEAFLNEKKQLEQMLQSVSDRAGYRTALEKQGYKISAINADKPDYLEYEVVKGDKSYEVQLDFDNNATKATKIDVTANMWRAEGTKKMMADAKYMPTGPLATDPEGRYSDRRYMKEWTGQKEELEKALRGPNMKAGDYAAKLKEMGYQITSVNDREADYLEYEIVKGNNSYEVQIDLDPATKMGRKVDVATNLWETDATERAKGEKK